MVVRLHLSASGDYEATYEGSSKGGMKPRADMASDANINGVAQALQDFLHGLKKPIAAMQPALESMRESFKPSVAMQQALESMRGSFEPSMVMQPALESVRESFKPSMVMQPALESVRQFSMPRIEDLQPDFPFLETHQRDARQDAFDLDFDEMVRHPLAAKWPVVQMSDTLLNKVLADAAQLENGTACLPWGKDRSGLVQLLIGACGDTFQGLLNLIPNQKSWARGDQTHILRINLAILGKALVAKGAIVAVGKWRDRFRVLPAEWFESHILPDYFETLGPCREWDKIKLHSPVLYIPVKDALEAFAIPVAMKGGPTPSDTKSKEKLAITALQELHASDVLARVVRSEVEVALVHEGFSHNHAKKIWESMEIPAWKIPGARPKGARVFTVSEITEALKGRMR